MWKNTTIFLRKKQKHYKQKKKKFDKKHMKNLTFWPNPIFWNISNQTLEQNEGFIKNCMPQWSTKRKNVNLKLYCFQKAKQCFNLGSLKGPHCAKKVNVVMISIDYWRRAFHLCNVNCWKHVSVGMRLLEEMDVTLTFHKCTST
jgi:hypothetical protein